MSWPRRTEPELNESPHEGLSEEAERDKDRISDLAQRELLFYVLRDREVFPNRTGKASYCCAGFTSKLYECVSAKVFRYNDNAKWKAEDRARPASFEGTWNVRSGADIYDTAARKDALRNTVNHFVHHRGQLTVYLRLLGVPIPSCTGLQRTRSKRRCPDS